MVDVLVDVVVDVVRIWWMWPWVCVDVDVNVGIGVFVQVMMMWMRMQRRSVAGSELQYGEGTAWLKEEGEGAACAGGFLKRWVWVGVGVGVCGWALDTRAQV